MLFAEITQKSGNINNCLKWVSVTQLSRHCATAALHRAQGTTQGLRSHRELPPWLQGRRWPFRSGFSTREAQAKEGGVGTAGPAGVHWIHACALSHDKKFTFLSYSLTVLWCFSSGILLGWLEAWSGCHFWRRGITVCMTGLFQSQPMHTCLICLDNIQRLNGSKPPLSKVFQHK